MDLSTKEKIKEISLGLFAQKGYEGTSMSEIAKMVGIKKASLYAHYAGKEALFFAILDDLEKEYMHLTTGIMEDCEAQEIEVKLRRMFEEYVRYYAARPEIQAFWTQSLFFAPSDINRRIFDQLKNYQAHVERWIQQAIIEGMSLGIIPEDDPYTVLFAYLSFREGFLNGLIFLPEMNREEMVGKMWSYLWLGMKGRVNSETEKAI